MPSRFIIANREAFHSLLQKLRPMSNLGEVFTVRPSGSVIASTGMRTSCVCVVMLASVNRMASAPWLSMMSSGSMPLPRLLDILRPSPSWIIAWMNTSRNGMSPAQYWPIITMRETHSVMISRAVQSTLPG